MYTKWASHIADPQEKINFERHVVSARPVLDRLRQLLEEDKAQLDKVEMNVKQFDNPNWDYRQAFYNGSKASYTSILKLIDLDQQKEQPNDRQSIS